MVNLSSLIGRFNLIKHIPVFEGLNWIELQRIARKATVAEYKKGDIICHEGSPPDYFYCLVSGRLQAYTNIHGGGKENVEFIHRGAHFGIISILTGESHSTSFETINDSVILKIPKDDFHAILHAMPHLGIRISRTLSQHIRGRVQGVKSSLGSTIIAVYSPVQGTGSSTYAIHLALSLRKETGKKVIFVNIHSRQRKAIDAGAQAGTQRQPCLPEREDFLHWRTPAIDLNEIVGDHEEILKRVIKEDLPVDLLNVAFNPADTSFKRQIGLFVSAFVGDYHYVILDLPNEMDEIVLEVLTQSDFVHLITLDRAKDLELVRKDVDRLEETLRGKFREEKIRIILRPLPEKHSLSFADINKRIDYNVYAILPNVQELPLPPLSKKEGGNGEGIPDSPLSPEEGVKGGISEPPLFIKEGQGEFKDGAGGSEKGRHGEVTREGSRDSAAQAASRHLFFLQFPPQGEYARAVTRIAREIGGVSVGLVLGGGAALGIAHIGVLRVLERENIPIDIVVGSSMGALIAALWAIGKGADEIEGIAREFSKKRALLNLVDPVFPVSGLIGGRAIKLWLRRHFGNRTFYDTRIPLNIIAYDLIRRQEMAIDSGSLVEAIRKSIAIPGVIEPVREKDRLIIDGGVLNPLPTNALVKRGIKKIIAVNVLQSPEDVCAGFEMARRAEAEEDQLPFRAAPLRFLRSRIGRFLLGPFRHTISDIIVRTLQASEYIIAEKSAQEADVLIHPDLVGINWFELYRVDDLVERGESAARQALAEIKKLTAAQGG
jgi:predicted acylesterase/phospholipase RssA/cellulose biosynthesis protein BcsQ